MHVQLILMTGNEPVKIPRTLEWSVAEQATKPQSSQSQCTWETGNEEKYVNILSPREKNKPLILRTTPQIIL